MNYIIAFLVTLISFLAIDAIWLTTMAPRFYREHIGHLLAEAPRLIPAGIFYVVFCVGILVFVVMPALTHDTNLVKVAGIGALLGVVTYATYDLTNQATLKDWPSIVTFVDLIWGAVLTGTVSCIAVVVTRYFVS